jgi:hypothetical protein
MSNCKSCSAPLPLNLNICEYCGTKIEVNNSAIVRDINSATAEIVKVVPDVLRSDNYKTQNNSIKPQFNQQDAEIHWTIILSFVFSIILFIGSFSAERDKDWILGFAFFAFLCFAFNFSGVKNFSQKNWMVTTNYVLLGLSILCSFIVLF